MSKRGRRAQPLGWSRDEKLREPRTHAVARAAMRARSDLAQANPLQSAKTPAGRIAVFVLIGLTILSTLGALSINGFGVCWVTASYCFAAIGVLRALAGLLPYKTDIEFKDETTPEAAPMWTILIALYKEADSVGALLTALGKLEWAQDRLDIIFACENDDWETLQTLAAHQNLHNFRIIRVPEGGPRTKPNALQTALPFAQGRFLTVYDAEDRPDPRQLRAAFHAFVTAPPQLAVVQAPLVTWNHNESWIAAQFALDYAIWFRVMLPAFARVAGLIPLGGTSNHFKTDILRKVGGWDPYNVTEDADLGVRMGRRGYRTSLITPPTYEEAPPRVSAWVKQRGRWIQGHIQTFSLHLRTPISLYRDIGWDGLVAFAIGLGIGPMSALLVLPSLLGLMCAIAAGTAGPMTWAPFCIGLLGHFVSAVAACARDKRWALMGCMATLPIYHALQSIAACRALWRVVFTPSIWDKTDHGLAARQPKTKAYGNIRVKTFGLDNYISRLGRQ